MSSPYYILCSKICIVNLKEVLLMKEILRSDTDIASLPIPISGSPVWVYSTAIDLDTTQTVFSASSTKSSSSGYYNFTLSGSASDYDRKIKVTTTASYSNTSSVTVDFFELNRPFVTLDKIKSYITLSSSVTDTKLLSVERLIRMYIQSEVLDNFYKENKIVVSFGEDSDVLYLDKRILSISEIYEEDILIYSASSDAMAANYLSESDVDKYTLKAVPSTGSVISVTTPNGVYEHTGVYLITYDGMFAKNTKYTVKGSFGWDYVPSDVEQATLMMIEDQFCKDISIRNKGIQKLQNDSYTIEYMKGFTDGSGNILADHIIQKYKSLRINPRII